ncbi:aconitate hydratase AcnA [Coxiella endosymbiont of Amblyomma americanum]|uniref:aconitate hydratase AcnA n=1 Tax=Coxiella endosymbiont of Amblyomma americanum TaxID=325775 RepID=UPI00057CFA2F|nr:aconitate hydratase AcnA [Coxiella endosymbiont of Amblyomma americanum]AJC50210.1 aconitate hydratase [Coxiella endosymbiont of Amblyomma americanum]AUJ58572.1 aconitate hydratase [Coxiella-like endosymbiont of Amblyomma americanum]
MDSFKTLRTLIVNGETYYYYSLIAAEKAGLSNIRRLPCSLKILLENQLRHEDGQITTWKHIKAFTHWMQKQHSDQEIVYRPVRILMQDFTGVPAIVDLAAMRDAMEIMNSDPNKINPHCPVDLIVDHSIQVDTFGNKRALRDNMHLEMRRNYERYTFLKWGQKAFHNFQLVPPGTGICHQVNLEYLGRVIWHSQVGNKLFAYPDTVIGTDSHTTMINGLGILGWGVGGIEAEAVMLGQPISMSIPEVVGFHLSGKLQETVNATDLVLTITQILRRKGVVGKFVEFYGSGLSELSIADRATVSNMAPEYGATCGFFPIDTESIKYMKLTGRNPKVIALTKAYSKAQGIWYDENTPKAAFSDTIFLDLSTVTPSISGPTRPQDRVELSDLRKVTECFITTVNKTTKKEVRQVFKSTDNYDLHHGDVVIAAITSCTNTSNPSTMLTAGLLAKMAVEKGLKIKPWVKSSLAPGSKVVMDYLKKTRLINFLERLGFYLVGYGCTTCIGNSGPLSEEIAKTIIENNLIVSTVLSGNRNFEGRIHPLVKANWLMSPPLVIAFALAGTTRIDLTKDPLGTSDHGELIYLRDIWPSCAEINREIQIINSKVFREKYSDVFTGDSEWQSISVSPDNTFKWQNSTYIKKPPFFNGMSADPKPLEEIQGARVLVILGDSVTTDHISPAGPIKLEHPAGKYLIAQGVIVKDFNSYGSRRGNYEVMTRGMFTNVNIQNEMLSNTKGGLTKHFPDGKELFIYDAAMKYCHENVPLVIIAGKEYGTGSSRDWAAKGTKLLGVKAVIAESFERIHRANLVGMGILPLEFKNGANRKSLTLDGSEVINITGIKKDLKPKKDLIMTIRGKNRTTKKISLYCRIDTENELIYYKHGGILQFVLRQILSTS